MKFVRKSKGFDVSNVFDFLTKYTIYMSEIITFTPDEITDGGEHSTFECLFDGIASEKILKPAANKKISLSSYPQISIEPIEQEEDLVPTHPYLEEEENEEDEGLLEKDADAEIMVPRHTPMSEDTFWALIYLLFYKPELGKKLLHVKLSKTGAYAFIMHTAKNDAYVVYFSQRGRAGSKFWHVQADDYIANSLLHNGYELISPIEQKAPPKN